MLTITCSSCQRKLSAKEDAAGKKVKCPGCGQVTTVLAQSAPIGTEATRPLPPAPDAELPTIPPKPVDASNTRTNPWLSEPDVTHGVENDAAGHDASLTDFLAPPQADDELGRLGEFRVLKILGHGGMGVVFMGEDPKLGRKVAIKAMLPHLAQSRSSQVRFLREARAAAALEHDHIVPIFHVGEDRGAPYIVMPFLKGQPLDQRLHGAEPMPVTEILRMGREVARALEAAHKSGLIHRDIKPANIWLEGPEERVKILDFGLARATSQAAGLTQQGAIVGTPSYMSPEQARGETVDARCDLWSLGVVLYRMGTGQQPFVGKDAVSTLMAVAMNKPAAPIQINAALPPELSDLVMHLLEKDLDKRVKTAAEVVQSLQAIEKELIRKKEAKENTVAIAVPIIPKPSVDQYLFAVETPSLAGGAKAAHETAPSLPIALPPLTQRNRGTLIAMALASFFGVILLFGIYYWQTNNGIVRIEINDPEIKVSFDQDGPTITGADQKDIKLRAGEYGLHVERGDLKFDTNQFILQRGETVTLRIEWLKAGKLVVLQGERVIDVKDFAKAKAPPVTGDAAPVVPRAAGPPLVASLKQDQKVAVLGFTPEGLLVSAGRGIKILDLAKGSVLKDLADKNVIRSLAVSRDGKTLFYSGMDRNQKDEIVVRAIDRITGAVVQTFPVEGGALAVALSPDEKTLAYHFNNGDESKRALVQLADPKTGAKGLAGEVCSWYLRGCKFSADGSRLAVVNHGQQLRILDVKTMQDAAKPVFLRGIFDWVDVTEDGLIAVPEGGDKGLGGNWCLYDLNGNLVYRNTKLGTRASAGTLSPDGQRLAVGGEDGDIYLWSIRDKRELLGKWPAFEPRAKDGPMPIRTVAFSRNGKMLAAAGDAGIIKVWDLAKWLKVDAPPALAAWSLDFDGNSRVNLPSLALNVDEPLTVEAWVTPRVQTSKKDPTVFDVGWIHQTFNLGKSKWQIRLPQSDPKWKDNARLFWSDQAYSPGKRTHLAAVWTGKEIFFYVNGQQQTGHDRVLVDKELNRRSFLGVNFHGQFHQFRVSKARRYLGLTGAISERFDSDDKTLLLYRFEEGQGNILNDSSGNKNHGTIAGDKWVKADASSVEPIAGAVKPGPPALLYSLPFKSKWQSNFDANSWVTGFSSDGRLFLAAGDAYSAGNVPIWETATGKIFQELVPKNGVWFSNAKFLPGGSNYVVAAYKEEKDLYLWDLTKGKVVRKFAGHATPEPGFAVSPNGTHILSWANDKTLRLWEVDTGIELRQLKGHTDKAAGVFAPDGTQILTFSPDKTLRLWDVESGKELRKLEGHTDAPEGSFSPDGKQAVSYAPDQTIRLWDLATGKEIRQFGDVLFKPNFANFVAGGHQVVGNIQDKKFRVWDTDTAKLVREIDCAAVGENGWSITASPDGRLALVSHIDGSVRVYDLATGQQIHRYDNCPLARAFSFSPDGTLAMAGSFRRGVYVFRLPLPGAKAAAPWQPLLDADLTKWGKHEEGQPEAIKVLDLGKELVLRLKQEKKSAYLWPKESFQDHHWRLEFQFPGKETGKYFVMIWAKGRFGFKLSSDGKAVAILSKEAAANRGILQAGALVAKEALKQGNTPLADADLEPAGAWNRLDVVRVGSSFALFVNGRFLGALTDVRWPEGGKETEFTGKDVTGTLQVYRGEVWMRRIEIRDIDALPPELLKESARVPELKPLQTIRVAVSGVAFSAEGVPFAAAGKLLSWDPKTFAARPELAWASNAQSVAFSRDGKYAAIGGAKGMVKLFGSDGNFVRDLPGHTNGVSALAFSADGKLLAAGSGTNTERDNCLVKVWRIPEGAPLPLLPELASPYMTVEFSPDGRYVAAGGWSLAAHLWDLQNPTARPLRLVSKNASGQSVRSVAFGPDSKTIFTGCDDGMVRLWNPADGKLLATHDLGFAIDRIGLSPDGKLLFAGGAKGSARLLDAASMEPLAQLAVAHEGGTGACSTWWRTAQGSIYQRRHMPADGVYLGRVGVKESRQRLPAARSRLGKSRRRHEAGATVRGGQSRADET